MATVIGKVEPNKQAICKCRSIVAYHDCEVKEHRPWGGLLYFSIECPECFTLIEVEKPAMQTPLY